jgi:hypothetical protein
MHKPINNQVNVLLIILMAPKYLEKRFPFLTGLVYFVAVNVIKSSSGNIPNFNDQFMGSYKQS